MFEQIYLNHDINSCLFFIVCLVPVNQFSVFIICSVWIYAVKVSIPEVKQNLKTMCIVRLFSCMFN
jgi:hypothetical protein